MPTTYKVLGQTTSTTAVPIILNTVWDGEMSTLSATTANVNTTTYTTILSQSNWNMSHVRTSGTGTMQAFRSTNGDQAADCLMFYWGGATSAQAGSVYVAQGVPNGTTAYSTSYTPGTINIPFVAQNVSKTINFGFSWNYRVNTFYDDANKPEMKLDFFDSSNTYISSLTVTATETEGGISGGTWYRTNKTDGTIPAGAVRMAIQIKLGYNGSLAANNDVCAVDSVFCNINGYNYSIRTNINAPTDNLTYVAPYNAISTVTNVTTTATTTAANSSAIGWASPGAYRDIYTAPASTSAVVSSLLVSNLATSATTYRITVVPSGQTLGLKHFVCFDESIAANTSVTRTLGLTLAAGDKLQVVSANTTETISAMAFGSEIS